MVRTLLAVVLLLSLVGCGGTLRQVTLRDGAPVVPPTDSAAVRVLPSEQGLAPDAEITGKVFVAILKPMSVPAEENMASELRALAAETGADGITGFHFNCRSAEIYCTEGCYATGLTFRDAGSREKNRSIPFILALLPIVDVTDSESVHPISEEFPASSLRYRLEKQGYYVRMVGTPVSLEMIETMSALELEEMIGPEPGVLMLVSLEELSGESIGIAGGKSAVVTGRLIDRDTRAVLWETQQTDSASSVGLIPTLMTAHREEAICGALQKIAEAVPPVHSPAGE